HPAVSKHRDKARLRRLHPQEQGTRSAWRLRPTRLSLPAACPAITQAGQARDPCPGIGTAMRPAITIAGVRCCLALAASVCFVVGPPAWAAGPRVQEFTLSNGMKALIVEEPKAPVITVQIWYKVGSRNEVMGRAGLSHMLEHMM